MACNPIQYTGSTMAVASKSGALRKFFLIPQIEDLCYGFRQDYQQAASSFAAVALNTVSPDDATAFLQNETELADMGAGMVQWTRTYCQVPPAWDDWENVSYTFPQYPGYIRLSSSSPPAANQQGRDPYTPVNGVTCRVRRDYFMVGTGLTYATEGAIPVISVQTFHGLLNPNFYTSPTQVTPVGGIVIGNTQYLESVPNRTVWDGWVANAAASGWACGRVGTADANPGQIVISCKPERLLGNIWARVTRYVLAL